MDEAALTGESVPVEKTASGPDQAGGVSAGTVVVRGRGRAVVTATGAAFLRDLLHTQPLPATDLLIVCALSSLGYAAVRLDGVVHRDKTAAAARHRLAKA